MLGFRKTTISPDRLRKAVNPSKPIESMASFAAQRTIESAFARMEEFPERLGPSLHDLETFAIAIADTCESLANSGVFRTMMLSPIAKIEYAFEDALSRRSTRMTQKAKSAIQAHKKSIVDRAFRHMQERAF